MAAECFARALALDPSGQPGALVELAHTKQLLCDWKGRDRDRSLVEAQLKQELGAHSAQAGRLMLGDSSCPRTLPPLSVQPAIAAALPLSLATQQVSGFLLLFFSDCCPLRAPWVARGALLLK